MAQPAAADEGAGSRPLWFSPPGDEENRRRVLDKLTPTEQEAFLKAMDLLETELRQQDIDS